ncbi:MULTISPECIES: DUF7108 domain-containing protein [unclassified Halobacterium]|jgi:hypothetical protein|uniref:DUF7108 domain-containing protein n=1 Tax=unclassified Halobacterium TaxID=2668073 RepID=UPI001E305FF4|nr:MULTISPECIES: rnhA operon protein [unclassified Halobacterium]MCD2198555.1 rnhA operon protein [Halobacterium sp. KA-4]MCD2201967.1 rnhA operon protein [Halobacterium sp. KA-6]
MTDLPDDVVDEAERLTRLARDAVDDAAAEAYRDRRESLLAEHGFVPRLRERDDTLVCYPGEWLGDDGRVQLDDVEDTDRAAEVSLSGPGEQGDYEEAAARNEQLVERVRERHGDVHGDNAAAFAEFMNNYYARSMDTADDREREEFLAEYFPRNAWPTDEQQERVEESLALIFEVAADDERDDSASASDAAPEQ